MSHLLLLEKTEIVLVSISSSFGVSYFPVKNTKPDTHCCCIGPPYYDCSYAKKIYIQARLRVDFWEKRQRRPASLSKKDARHEKGQEEREQSRVWLEEKPLRTCAFMEKKGRKSYSELNHEQRPNFWDLFCSQQEAKWLKSCKLLPKKLKRIFGHG